MESDVTYFSEDLKKGLAGERFFVKDFLEYYGIDYKDVSKSLGARVLGTDFSTGIGLCEVKNSYRSNRVLIIEEYTNVDTSLGPKKLGWLYTSKADFIVFTDPKNRRMVILKFDDHFKEKYSEIRKQTKLLENKVSIGHDGARWRSAFRAVPFSLLDGFIVEHALPDPNQLKLF